MSLNWLNYYKDFTIPNLLSHYNYVIIYYLVLNELGLSHLNRFKVILCGMSYNTYTASKRSLECMSQMHTKVPLKSFTYFMYKPLNLTHCRNHLQSAS